MLDVHGIALIVRRRVLTRRGATLSGVTYGVEADHYISGIYDGITKTRWDVQGHLTRDIDSCSGHVQYESYVTAATTLVTISSVVVRL